MTTVAFVVRAHWLCYVFAQCCLSPQGRLSGFHFFYAVLVSLPLIFCLIFPYTSFRAKSFWTTVLLCSLFNKNPHNTQIDLFFFLQYARWRVDQYRLHLSCHEKKWSTKHACSRSVFFLKKKKTESTMQTYNKKDNSLLRNIIAQWGGFIGMRLIGHVLRMS